METSKVKCRECKARATQYEGALPTRGVAKVLVAGFAIYILGLWVLVALAGFTTGDAAEVGMMDMLIVLASSSPLPRPGWCGGCSARRPARSLSARSAAPAMRWCSLPSTPTVGTTTRLPRHRAASFPKGSLHPMREARLLPPHPRHLPPIPKNPEKPFDRERRSVKLLTRC